MAVAVDAQLMLAAPNDFRDLFQDLFDDDNSRTDWVVGAR